MKKTILFVVILAFPLTAISQTALENCSEQFIDGQISNAPTIYSSDPEEPYGSNEHLCYRDDDVSFFALEYWPEEFAPRWAAYKITPSNYGDDGCSTYTRKIANCYIKENTWAEFQSCTSESDPFHSDKMLSGTKLSSGDFSNTGHDRGHIAPRQAFNWHVCATYQTFSMANMSPQKAFLNQDIWASLENQVLTWGIDEGPIYVVTGTTFRTFPHDSFSVYEDNTLNPDAIYQYRAEMQSIVEQHHTNYTNTAEGDILRPKRDANPSNINDKVENMRMPTGYFKVIYRPAIDGEPAHAIGFLLPHTFENLNMLSDEYDFLVDGREYWVFVSRIDLIEEVSGVRFPGIPDSLKSSWGDSWFMEHDENRSDLRPTSCGRGNPQGVLPDSTKAQRIDACTDHLTD